MSEEGYSILDTSFISRVYRLDRSCKHLLYDISKHYSSKCAILDSEYKNPGQPCNQVDHQCISARELVNSEQVKAFARQPKIERILSKVFAKISSGTHKGFHPDITILAVAHYHAGSIVFSCDENVLKACERLKVNHLCVKASLTAVDKETDMGVLFVDERFDLQKMLKNQCNDAFLDFLDDGHCRDCKSGLCTFPNDREDYIEKFTL